jgi:hypothetical protein
MAAFFSTAALAATTTAFVAAQKIWRIIAPWGKQLVVPITPVAVARLEHEAIVVVTFVIV